MPSINGNAQIQRTGPLPQARPASVAQASVTRTQTPAGAAAPSDQPQIQSRQGSSATSIDLFSDAPSVGPVAPKSDPKDFERVKKLVSTQLSQQGIDPQKAFGIGSQLSKAAEKTDLRMPSKTMSYAAVKHAIDDALNVPYQPFGGKDGGSAKTAGKNLLSKSPEFVQLTGIQRNDLDNLPAGAVVVFKPEQGHGHIGVQNGQGKDISDVTRSQGNSHRTADFEVWFPVSVRDQN